MVYTPREDSYLLLSVVKKLRLRNKKVLDMGTGSGIIAIEAAKKGAIVDAVDIDPEALKLRHKGINVFYSDLFSNINKQYDYIFFNAPYLPKGLDPALDGGKHGYELLVRFINQLNNYLTINGKVFIVYSSLSKEEKIIEAANNNLLSIETVKKEHYFFEDIIVAKLERNNLNKHLFRNGYIVNGLIAKGKHSSVYALNNKALKVFKKELLYNLKKEVSILSYLNNTNAFFAPQLYGYNSRYRYLIEERVNGELITNEKKHLFMYLLAARQLDIRGVKKEELHMPQKHVYVEPLFRIIDYDRSHLKHNPGNLTQALQYVMFIIETKIDIGLLKKYKQVKEPLKEQVFVAILDKLGMKQYYDSLLYDQYFLDKIFYGYPEKYLEVYRAIFRNKQVLTYSDLALKLGMHPRTVARALSRNPLLIMIPCHLVIGKNSIGGYVLGIKKKKELLKPLLPSLS